MDLASTDGAALVGAASDVAATATETRAHRQDLDRLVRVYPSRPRLVAPFSWRIPHRLTLG
jgi:hypothetical protein